MHRFEKTLRSGLRRSVEGFSKLPEKLSTPILSSLADLPTWIARNRDMTAAISYWSSPMTGVPERVRSDSSIGILIQGPISDEFSVQQVSETVQTYKELFPRSPIVVSTWDSSRALLERQDFVSHVEVVFSPDPGPSFPTNINRQSVSTSSGLKALVKIGSELALKTRVDHRVASPSALAYLEAVWGLYPNQNRIIASSYGSGRYRLYGWTEQLQFGRTASLLRYWEGLPTEEPHGIAMATQDSSELARQGLAVHESRLNVRYMERLGVNAEWNWGDHLRAFTKLFGIADSYELRHLQLGREKTVLDHVYPWNDNFTNLYERHVSFADWLLYSHSQFEVDAPSPELLLASMKVPPSDQALLYATLVKTGGNQPS